MTLVQFMNQKQRTIDPWMNNMIDSILKESVSSNPSSHRSPLTNISEMPNAFEIEMAIPGVSKTDLKIDLEKDKMVVSYEPKKEERERKFSQRGFEMKAFSRSFHLPDSVDQEQIEASYTDGILHVRLVKKQETVVEPRQIAVK